MLHFLDSACALLDETGASLLCLVAFILLWALAAIWRLQAERAFWLAFSRRQFEAEQLPWVLDELKVHRNRKARV